MRTVNDSIAPFLQYRISAGELAPQSAREYRYTLRLWARVAGDVPLERLGQVQVDRLVESWDGIAPSTRRMRYATLRAWHRWCVQRRLVSPKLFDSLVMPRQLRRPPRSMTADQVAQVVSACDRRRDRALVLWAVQLGLRCCELARLDLADVDMSRWMVRVTGKGGHERVLPVPLEAREALEAYWAEVGLRPGPLFRNVKNGDAMTARRVTQVIGDAFRAAGVKRAAYDGLSAHALRHTMATDLMRERGASLMQVKAALGHSSVSSTQIYLSAIETDDLADVMAGRSYTHLVGGGGI